jgi:hypothetical protein
VNQLTRKIKSHRTAVAARKVCRAIFAALVGSRTEETCMPLKPYSLDLPRVHALLALYNGTRAELIRYRDLQWHVTAYIVGLQGAFLILIANDKFRSLWSTFWRGILTMILFALAFIGMAFIWIFYGKFKEHRERRSKLDKLLGFQDSEVFAVDGPALLPEERMGTNKIYPILFTLLIGLMGVVTIIAAVKI